MNEVVSISLLILNFTKMQNHNHNSSNSFTNKSSLNIIFLIGVHVCQSHIISKQGLAGNL